MELTFRHVNLTITCLIYLNSKMVFLVYQGEELEDKDPLILPISHHANSVGPNSSKIVIKRVIWN